MLLAALSLALLAQTPGAAAEAPTPRRSTQAQVHLETTARSASLIELTSRKKVCAGPCGQLLETTGDVAYQLVSPEVLESAPFSLENATTDVTVRWRPATTATRVFGVGLIIIGGVAVLTAIAMGLSALILGVSCTASGRPCPSFTWAYATIPLSVGGYVLLGIGMTLTFRFGIEKLEVEVAPPQRDERKSDAPE